MHVAANVYTKEPFSKHVDYDLNVSRPTATKYLDALAADGFLLKFEPPTTTSTSLSNRILTDEAMQNSAAGD